MTASPDRPPRRVRRGPLAVLTGLALAVVALVVVAVRLLAGVFGPAADYSGDGYGAVTVRILPGASQTAIGQTLYDDHVVASVSAYTAAASDNPNADRIQPGYYRLHLHMSAAAALAALLDPASRAQTTVVIPEGFTVAAIVSRLAADTDLSLASLRAALHDPAALGLPRWAHGHAEGLLYPATYEFPPGITATQALRTMVDRFKQEAATLHLASAAKRVGLTEYQAVILASILEHEYKQPADLPKIAEVFLNRYHRGMPLGSNATLAYVLGRPPTTTADLHLNSPYNTEFRPGFPPTPIGSPGEATLQAVLHPARGNLLYFVIVDRAGHAAFASTEAGYQRIAAEAHANGLH